MKILLAGILPRRLQRLRKGLLSSRHRVNYVQTSAQVWQTVMRERIDTIVLDTTASNVDLDPWRLCGELRQATNALVIALTRAGQNQDRVRAFRAGAFQCLTMPVSPADLAACLDSVPRPRRPLVPDSGLKHTPSYADSILQIDIVHRLIRREGRVFTLSPREAVLLQWLIQNQGNIVQREDLCEAVWLGAAAATAEQRLKIYISALRQKIEHDPKRPCYIISRRGTGYGFIPGLKPGCSEDVTESTGRLPEQELAAVDAAASEDALTAGEMHNGFRS